MSEPRIKGPARVLGPEEGASYWQPGPHRGYMTVKLGPHNLDQGGNNCAFSMGIQVMPPGCHVRAHGHAQNDEVFYILEGTGRCVIDGETHALVPGSTVMLGRFCEHSIHNDGDKDLKFVWFFTPPGLEQVVEAAGKPRKAGDAAPENIERPANIAEVLKNAGYATPEEIAASKKRT